MFTPSPIRSPSLSSTTSPRWIPTRNSMRRSGGRPSFRSIMLFCTSTAQRTASTTLRNSTRRPSPVRLTTRPLCTAIVGSIRSLRRARRRASVRSSSALASRLYPTTSAARIAASFRVSVMTYRQNPQRNEVSAPEMWARLSRPNTEFCHLTQGVPGERR